MSLLRIQLSGIKKLESTQASSQINHMPNVKGRFYFKLTTSGNLLGEYSNQGTPRSRPESALRGDDTSGASCESTGRTFIGKYFSTWFEPHNQEAVKAILVITQRGSTPDQFAVTWSDLQSSKVLFSGEAMLCDGMLIGDYRSGK